jgi:hypothetical protein
MNSEKALRNHKQHAHSANMRQLKCPVCNRICKGKIGLNSHLVLHSSDIVKCDECGFEAKTKQGLLSHKKEKHSNEEHKCDLCGYVALTAFGLRAHIKTHEDKHLICDICKREFKTNGALVYHKNHTHSKEKHLDEVCDICGKHCNGTHGLKMHMRMHDEEYATRWEDAQRLSRSTDEAYHRRSESRKKVWKREDFRKKQALWHDRHRNDRLARLGYSDKQIGILNSKEKMKNVIETLDNKNQKSLSEAIGVSLYDTQIAINRLDVISLLDWSDTSSVPEQHWREELNKICDFEEEVYVYGDKKRADFACSNLAIEINPCYTHKTFGDSIYYPKAIDYHFNKSRLAESNGYEVFNFWDWLDEKKALSFIKSKLHKDSINLSAHKTEAVRISQNDAKAFCDKYHLQNGLRQGQSYCYGLVKDDELLAVSTYGKPRFNKHYEYEWLRYCSKSGVHIYGGVSKLQNAFLEEVKPKSMITYTDYSRSNGKMDEALGWTFEKYTGPSLLWWNGCNLVKDTSLLRIGADRLLGTNYGSPQECGLDNHGIMIKEKYDGVYDCGSKIFSF